MILFAGCQPTPSTPVDTQRTVAPSGPVAASPPALDGQRVSSETVSSGTERSQAVPSRTAPSQRAAATDDAARAAATVPPRAAAPETSPASAPPRDAAAAQALEQRRLKELLPARLLDCPRVSAKSESTDALGIGVSLAEADYELAATPAGPRRKLMLRLTDAKRLGGLAGATAALSEVEIDKETEDGHEKTTTFDGRKAYERHSKSARSGEIHVVVSNRFLVELAGEDVTMDDLRKALKELDVARLEPLSKP